MSNCLQSNLPCARFTAAARVPTTCQSPPRRRLSPTPLSFEEAVGELEAIVEAMESGNLPLEESLTAYKRGVEGAARRSGTAGGRRAAGEGAGGHVRRSTPRRRNVSRRPATFPRLDGGHPARMEECSPPRCRRPTMPARLHDAMRYAVLGGGKRVRPLRCSPPANSPVRRPRRWTCRQPPSR